MWEQLSLKLLTPLIKRYKKVDRFKVVYLDEIIDWEQLKAKIESKEITYNIEKAKYYNEKDLEVELKRFLSSIQTR